MFVVVATVVLDVAICNSVIRIPVGVALFFVAGVVASVCVSLAAFAFATSDVVGITNCHIIASGTI